MNGNFKEAHYSQPGSLLGNRVLWLSATKSTMRDAALLAESGAAEGLVVVAGAQSAGQGRAGRNWTAPAWTSLLCSIVLTPTVAPAAFPTLSLLAGLAAAEAIETLAPVRIELKWPNDLWLEGRKLGGILIKARSRGTATATLVLGIGINVSTRIVELPPNATSLAEAGCEPPSLAEVLTALLERLARRYADWIQCDGLADLSSWRARAALLGEVVTVVEAGTVHTGRYLDVADDGALLLECAGTAPRRMVAGDLIRGPRTVSV